MIRAKQIIQAKNNNTLCLVLCLFAALFLTGCASYNRTRKESDVPWNAPQQWEGAPTIPGSSY